MKMTNKMLVFLLLLAVIATSAAAQAQETPLEITSTPSTTATVGQEYTYQVQAMGGSGGYTYSLTQNPSGMAISSTGFVSWTPSAAGTYQVGVRVTDSTAKVYIDQNYTITVSTGTPTPAAFSAGNVELGDENQERDERTTTVWEVTNTGSATTISGIAVEALNVGSDYNLDITVPSTNLGPGQTMNIEVSADVPLDQDSGISNLGQMKITGNAGGSAVTLTKDITLEAVNHLVIDQIEVDVDGKSDKLRSPGTVDEEAELGDDITITVKVENTFDENIDIEDIEVRIDSNDLDPIDGEREDMSDLGDGDDDEVEFSFNLDPDDVDADDEPFDITIKVTGEDENGATHEDEWVITLEMDVKSRDVKIKDAQLVPSTVSCEAKDVRITFELDNIGTRDLDDILVQAIIDDLNTGKTMRDIELDEGDDDSYTMTVPLPANLKAGLYIVELKAFPDSDNDDETDSELLDLTVQCGTPSNNEEDEEEPNTTGGTGINVQTGGTPTVPVSGQLVTTGSGSSTSIFTQGGAYLWVLILLTVLVLVMVILLAVRLTKK